MPEPLKNLINEHMIAELATVISQYYPDFNSKKFSQKVLADDWLTLELKERMRRISQTLQPFLPSDLAQSLDILKRTITHFNGFEYMYLPEFVELFAIDDYQLAVDALEHMTEYASSEFAVRPFIVKYPAQMMAQMNNWATSDNHHVRRLASEGCRPRLPWAMALPAFKKDPSEILPILQQLKNDESEYVRRSVANNLNDISKDNPEIVIDIAQSWLGDNKNTDWIVKHACRGLLKQGHPQVMAMFGYSAPDDITVTDLTATKTVAMGEKLEFTFALNTKSLAPLGKLRTEFAIGFMKSNGQQAKKVFKIAESEYSEVSKTVEKYFSFKPITTRKYYPGAHQLYIIVNGVVLAEIGFELV